MDLVDKLILPQTTRMTAMDERTAMRQRKEQERKYLPLPESFPQPLEAEAIKVKMQDETKRIEDQ